MFDVDVPTYLTYDYPDKTFSDHLSKKRLPEAEIQNKLYLWVNTLL